ncbi:ABC transporter ATP-binding protein [Microbacterium sp. 10M-3C3]|uniref:ATP-binding cassette domain-containing protein n=1 Tax=Microbacterium sp. 10M-3C3 TaxID=2483401 RepID=UPI001F0C872D|nr:ABC transporter ATP-binding protein [Microbacterium sp. 10M-3C3]
MSGVRAHVAVQRAHFAVDVAIHAAPGETVAVMGPSGAGKSTLVGAIAGFVPIDRGEIAIGDRVVERAGDGVRRHVPAMRRGVVLLGQDARLFPHLSAGENVAFGPRASGASRAQARALAAEWLERVGLPGTSARRPRELSGGEQQRVAVARALAAAPRAVLLDEPLVALDPATAAGIRTMLREQLAGTTTIAVTHDAVDAAALADRLVVLEAGAITQQGAVREVFAAPATAFVAAIAGLNRLLGRAAGGLFHGIGDAAGLTLASADPASRALAVPEGAGIAAVFRPADVRVGGADGAWRTTVSRLEPTPAGVRVWAGGCAVDLEAASAAGLHPGDGVSLTVPPECVRFVATLVS